MTKEEILSVVRAMKILPVCGALGELAGCGAYPEETKVTPNGYATKYFGITPLYKGKTDNDIIDRVTTAKKAVAEGLLIFWKFLPFISFTRIIKGISHIYTAEGGARSRQLRDNEFCPICQEVIRIGKKFAKTKEEHNLVYFAAMILQFSPSYRVRLQDILGEMKGGSILKEIWRLKRIYLSREKAIKRKAAMLFNLLFIFTVLNLKLVKDIFSEMNINKMKLDENDWYYCLRRGSYDFKGIPISERLKEAEEIDKKQGNVILGI